MTTQGAGTANTLSMKARVTQALDGMPFLPARVQQAIACQVRAQSSAQYDNALPGPERAELLRQARMAYTSLDDAEKALYDLGWKHAELKRDLRDHPVRKYADLLLAMLPASISRAGAPALSVAPVSGGDPVVRYWERQRQHVKEAFLRQEEDARQKRSEHQQRAQSGWTHPEYRQTLRDAAQAQYEQSVSVARRTMQDRLRDLAADRAYAETAEQLFASYAGDLARLAAARSRNSESLQQVLAAELACAVQASSQRAKDELLQVLQATILEQSARGMRQNALGATDRPTSHLGLGTALNLASTDKELTQRYAQHMKLLADRDIFDHQLVATVFSKTCGFLQHVLATLDGESMQVSAPRLADAAQVYVSETFTRWSTFRKARLAMHKRSQQSPADEQTDLAQLHLTLLMEFHDLPEQTVSSDLGVAIAASFPVEAPLPSGTLAPSRRSSRAVLDRIISEGRQRQPAQLQSA